MLRSNMFLLTIPVIILYGIRKYIESKWGKCRNTIKLNGQIAIITGANSGIGFEVTKELAARNATVILGCRNLQNAKEAIKQIKAKVKCSGDLIPMELDLASLSSIKQFVEQFKKNYKNLHILVNNAGVSFPKTKPELTKDGLEIHFGVNHFGHFCLTTLLLDVLERSRPSKVIIVSSKLHEKGIINLDDLNCERDPDRNNLYANSKLANVYFCNELARATKNNGIDVFAVCPGWIYTNLFRHSFKWYHYFIIAPIAFFFMRSPKQGSQTIIYCVTEPGLQSGVIYRDCRMYQSRLTISPTTSISLWMKCEEIMRKLEK